jgi:hypothetical protein
LPATLRNLIKEAETAEKAGPGGATLARVLHRLAACFPYCTTSSSSSPPDSAAAGGAPASAPASAPAPAPAAPAAGGAAPFRPCAFSQRDQHSTADIIESAQFAKAEAKSKADQYKFEEEAGALVLAAPKSAAETPHHDPYMLAPLTDGVADYNFIPASQFYYAQPKSSAASATSLLTPSYLRPALFSPSVKDRKSTRLNSSHCT